MGGQSSSTTTQSSSTQPWAASEPITNGLISGVSGLIPGSTALTHAQSDAIAKLSANGQAGNPYAPAIGNTANTLLAGGGATNEAGRVNQNYDAYLKATQPLASNTDYDPRNTPGFKDSIDALTADITGGVNGQFAAAGRSFSGANSQALGRGIAQGVAPVIAAQYNQNIQNQQNAARGLYDAGNTTAGIQTGLTQQDLANRQAGIGASDSALSADNYGAKTTLAAEALRLGIPAGNLVLLAQIGIPLAQLGTQSSGTSNTTNQMSGVQQFATLAGGLGSMGGGGSSGGGSGVLGLLNLLK